MHPGKIWVVKTEKNSGPEHCLQISAQSVGQIYVASSSLKLVSLVQASPLWSSCLEKLRGVRRIYWLL